MFITNLVGRQKVTNNLIDLNHSINSNFESGLIFQKSWLDPEFYTKLEIGDKKRFYSI